VSGLRRALLGLVFVGFVASACTRAFDANLDGVESIKMVDPTALGQGPFLQDLPIVHGPPIDRSTVIVLFSSGGPCSDPPWDREPRSVSAIYSLDTIEIVVDTDVNCQIDGVLWLAMSVTLTEVIEDRSVIATRAPQ